MKKSLRSVMALILTLLVMVSSVPFSASAYIEFPYFENEDYRYSVNEGEIKILDYLGDDEHIVIPETLDEMPVTFLAERSFQQVQGVKTITVPASVEVIEGNVFDFNPNLTDVFIEDGNPYFTDEDGVLFSKDMSALLFYPDGREATSYTVPEGVLVIGSMAFGRCNYLQEVIFPEGLLVLGQYVFFMNDGIREVHLPDSVIAVGEATFEYCDNLEEVTFGKNVEFIGEAPFKECPSLKSIVFDEENQFYKTVDGVLYSSENELVRYPEGMEYTDEYNILEGTKKIGKSAFESTANIHTINLPDSVETIDEYAFYHNRSSYINLSENLQHIEHAAFFDCQNLLEITVSDSVDYIGDSAFGACLYMEEAILPKEVSYFGTEVFSNCGELKNVTLPENLTVLPDFTFRSCVSLKDLPDLKGVKEIAYGAFEGCGSLTEIHIPLSVETIDAYAFANCRNLMNVFAMENLKELGDHVFYNQFATATLYGLKGSAFEAYAEKFNHPFVYIGDVNDETQDETTVPTEPDDNTTPTEPDNNGDTTPEVPTILMGDADQNGKVNIKDATTIQKNVAGLRFLTHKALLSSDLDNSGNVNVKDATIVQKHLAGIKTNTDAGKRVPCNEFDGVYVYIRDTANWGNIHCYCWNDSSSNSQWPGEKAELIGELNGTKIYRYYVPSIYPYIIIGSVFDSYSNELSVEPDAIFDTEKGEWDILLSDV